MRRKLSQKAVEEKLQTIEDWHLEDGQIKKEFVLDDFVEALQFVNKVGELAEEADHHPDILIRYNRVTFYLATHSAGGITEADFQLAVQIDSAAPAG
ncbi:MAG: putative pterin-4-alpha-carbinolamine dehydratase [Dehalococcoidia bacterium]|nr:putative pterin-4-alpha-carbinolamine dehydratase [Dehalococcoidia bacterium]